MVRVIATIDKAPTIAPGPQIHDHSSDSFQHKSAITHLILFKQTPEYFNKYVVVCSVS